VPDHQLTLTAGGEAAPGVFLCTVDAVGDCSEPSVLCIA
jgi:hypothetical protein